MRIARVIGWLLLLTALSITSIGILSYRWPASCLRSHLPPAETPRDGPGLLFLYPVRGATADHGVFSLDWSRFRMARAPQPGWEDPPPNDWVLWRNYSHGGVPEPPFTSRSSHFHVGPMHWRTSHLATQLRRSPAEPWLWIDSWSLTAPAWLLGALLIVGPLLFAGRRMVLMIRRPRIREGACCVCRYDLTGNISGICPECGTLVHAQESRRRAPDPRPFHDALLAVVLLLTLGLAAWSTVLSPTPPAPPIVYP